jgi:hypothetical protein
MARVAFSFGGGGWPIGGGRQRVGEVQLPVKTEL